MAPLLRPARCGKVPFDCPNSGCRIVHVHSPTGVISRWHPISGCGSRHIPSVTKPKPRWNVHLLGAGSPAGVLRPLTEGLFGGAA